MACLACVAGGTLVLAPLDASDEALLAASVMGVTLATWVLPDVFRIPGFVQDYNDRLNRWLSGDGTPPQRRGLLRHRPLGRRRSAPALVMQQSARP